MTVMQHVSARQDHELLFMIFLNFLFLTWQMQKQACDKHDLEFYPKYKKWCDDYFLIKVSD